MSQPITVGTSTRADSSSRTGLEIRSRRASRRAADSSAVSAGAVPSVFSRCTQTHPVASRSVSASTPTIHPATNNGSHGSTSMVQAGGVAPRAAGLTGAGAAGVDGVGACATRPASAVPAAVAATAAWLFHTCTAVTTGIVAINDSATVPMT